jgi:hypothetical protein
MMAPRAFWKGYLKLSLVTCPVAMSPAISQEDKVRFRTLNGKTGNPVVSRYVDAVTGKAVSEDDEVKGYPRGEHDYVMLTAGLEAFACDACGECGKGYELLIGAVGSRPAQLITSRNGSRATSCPHSSTISNRRVSSMRPFRRSSAKISRAARRASARAASSVSKSAPSRSWIRSVRLQM